MGQDLDRSDTLLVRAIRRRHARRREDSRSGARSPISATATRPAACRLMNAAVGGRTGAIRSSGCFAGAIGWTRQRLPRRRPGLRSGHRAVAPDNAAAFGASGVSGICTGDQCRRATRLRACAGDRSRAAEDPRVYCQHSIADAGGRMRALRRRSRHHVPRRGSRLRATYPRTSRRDATSRAWARTACGSNSSIWLNRSSRRPSASSHRWRWRTTASARSTWRPGAIRPPSMRISRAATRSPSATGSARLAIWRPSERSTIRSEAIEEQESALAKRHGQRADRRKFELDRRIADLRALQRNSKSTSGIPAWISFALGQRLLPPATQSWTPNASISPLLRPTEAG